MPRTLLFRGQTQNLNLSATHPVPILLHSRGPRKPSQILPPNSLSLQASRKLDRALDKRRSLHQASVKMGKHRQTATMGVTVHKPLRRAGPKTHGRGGLRYVSSHCLRVFFVARSKKLIMTFGTTYRGGIGHYTPDAFPWSSLDRFRVLQMTHAFSACAVPGAATSVAICP
jgi:hypothetical protein